MRSPRPQNYNHSHYTTNDANIDADDNNDNNNTTDTNTNTNNNHVVNHIIIIYVQGLEGEGGRSKWPFGGFGRCVENHFDF